MDSSIVGLIITGLAALFLIVSIIMGLIRGLKKSAIRAAIIIGIAIICMFITPPITNAIIKMDISFLNFAPDGQVIKSIYSFIETSITTDPQAAELFEYNPDLFPLIIKFASTIINVFVFVLLFWIFKIISWFIYAIVMRCTYGKKWRKIKKENILIAKQIKSGKIEGKDIKMLEMPKKYRWAGALVGVVLGLFIGCLTLTPINQLAITATQINAYQIEAELTSEEQLIESALGEEKYSATMGRKKVGLVEYAMGKDFYSYIESVAKSPEVYAYRYTGMEGINSIAFNYVSSFTQDGVKFNLKNDMVQFAKVGSELFPIMETNYDNLSNEEMTVFIEDVKALASDAIEIKAINILADEYLPFCFHKIETTDLLISFPDPIMNAAVDKIAGKMKNLKFKDYANDFISMLDMALIVNEDISINTILKSKDSAEIIQGLTIDTVKNASEKLFSMNTTAIVTPIVIDAGLKIIGEEINVIIVSPLAELTAEQVKESGSKLITNTFEFYKTLDFNDSLFLTESSFEPLGKLLNNFKTSPFITTDTYNNLFKFAQDEMKAAINESQMDSISFKTSLNSTIDRIRLVENWETECLNLKTVYPKIKTIINSPTTDDSFVSNAIILGEILDVLKQGTIFTDSNIKIMLKSFVSMLVPEGTSGAINEIINGKVEGGIVTENGIVQKIDLISSTDINAYKKEFSYLKSFYNNIESFKNVSDTTEVNTETIVNLGNAFESIRGSILFGDSGKRVMLYFVDSIPITSTSYVTAIQGLRDKVNAFNPATDSYIELFNELITIKTTIDKFTEFSSKETKTVEDVSEILTLVGEVGDLDIIDIIAENAGITGDVGEEIVSTGLAQIRDSFGTGTTEYNEINNLITNMDTIVDGSAANYVDKYDALFEQLKSIIDPSYVVAP